MNFSLQMPDLYYSYITYLKDFCSGYRKIPELVYSLQ